jgi:hypothetical protein
MNNYSLFLNSPPSSSNITLHVEVEMMQKINDFLRVGLFPFICIIGMITNGLNCKIFYNLKAKENVLFIFLLASSIVDFFYLFGVILVAIPNCGNYCSPEFKKNYLSQWIRLYISDYFTSCLAIFNIFIDLTVSFQRYIIIKNDNRFNIIKKRRIIFFLLILSLVYYSPELIFKKIVKINESNQTAYKVVSTNFENKFHVLKPIQISLQLIRGPLSLIVLVLINVLTWYGFKSFIATKVYKLALKLGKNSILTFDLSLFIFVNIYY